MLSTATLNPCSIRLWRTQHLPVPIPVANDSGLVYLRKGWGIGVVRACSTDHPRSTHLRVVQIASGFLELAASVYLIPVGGIRKDEICRGVTAMTGTPSRSACGV